MATAPKDKATAPEIKGQGRSASYPWIDLKVAEERVAQFWAGDRTYEVPLKSAYTHWSYGEKSSGARLTIAAMLNYGLMIDRGTGDLRTVKLTPLAVELMMAPSEELKAKARKIAALKPKVFADLLKEMDPENLPSDQTITHYLVTQKNFNPNGAETFLKPFKGTIAHAKLKKSDIMSSMGSASELPLEAPPAKVPVGAYVQWESNGVLQFSPPRQVTRVSDDGEYVFVEGSNTGVPVAEVTVVDGVAQLGGGGTSHTSKTPPQQFGFKQDVYTLGSEGQVILQWPEKMGEESYEELQDWLDLQMRKIARLNGITPKEKK